MGHSRVMSRLMILVPPRQLSSRLLQEWWHWSKRKRADQEQCSSLLSTVLPCVIYLARATPDASSDHQMLHRWPGWDPDGLGKNFARNSPSRPFSTSENLVTRDNSSALQGTIAPVLAQSHRPTQAAVSYHSVWPCATRRSSKASGISRFWTHWSVYGTETCGGLCAEAITVPSS